MKLVRMQYSPDGFENFLRNKLDEVKPDPSLQDQLWADFEKMNQQKKPRGGNKWFTGLGLIIVAVAVYLLVANDPAADEASRTSPQEQENNSSAVVTPGTTERIKPEPAEEMNASVSTDNREDEVNDNNDNNPASGPAVTTVVQQQETSDPVHSVVSDPEPFVNTHTATTGATILSERTITAPSNVQLPPVQMVTVQPVISDTAKKSAAPSKTVKKKTPVNIIW